MADVRDLKANVKRPNLTKIMRDTAKEFPAPKKKATTKKKK